MDIIPTMITYLISFNKEMIKTKVYSGIQIALVFQISGFQFQLFYGPVVSGRCLANH